MNKKAEITPEQRAALLKYIKAGLGAGVLASGIGLVTSRIKANRKRSAYSPEKSKNAIIVDINRDNFLKDIPSPADQAELVGGYSAPKKLGVDSQVAMTDEDIAAIKKRVRDGRKLDFLGLRKAAKSDEGDKASDPVEKNDDKNGSGDNDKKDESRNVLRDPEGRFVSPTSPIALSQSEKEAGILDNFLIRPVLDTVKDFGGRMWGAAITHPLGISAGGLGAIYLSALIVDRINKIRSEKSKERSNSARTEYIRLLQGADDSVNSEKTAQAGIPEWTGGIVGSSLVVPFIISAMITNRIMENRREKEKKLSQSNKTFPDSPFILYKTSEAKEIELSPDSAYLAVLLKSAMHKVTLSMEKSAEVFDEAKEKMYDMATNSIIDELGRPTNSGNVLNIAKAYHAYNEGTGSKGDIYKSYIPIAMQTPISSSFASLNRDEMMRRIAADKRTADILTGYINDDNDKNWKAWKDEVISNKIGRYIRPGSPLFNFFRHMSGIFGIGKHFASSAIRNKLKSIAGNARI